MRNPQQLYHYSWRNCNIGAPIAQQCDYLHEGYKCKHEQGGPCVAERGLIALAQSQPKYTTDLKFKSVGSHEIDIFVGEKRVGRAVVFPEEAIKK